MVKSEAGVEAYSCNLSPQEADTGLQIQPGLHNKDIKKNKTFKQAVAGHDPLSRGFHMPRET